MTSLAQFKRDASVSAFIAGLIVILVGMTSSAVVVFQAAQAFGATPEVAGSWLGSLCVGMSLLTIVLCLKYRVPVLLAWSTPGAVLLATAANGFSMAEGIGAFLFCSFLVFLFGITGIFEKIMNKISMSLTSALLAGVLLHFCLDAFTTFKSNPLLIGLMFVAYIAGRKFWSQMTMLAVLLVGILVASFQGVFAVDMIGLSFTQFEFLKPEFSMSAMISIGIPLFVVTMASQNLTGLAVLKAHDYEVPISPVIGSIGAVSFFSSFFGGYAISFAAITAAITMNKDAHRDRDRRYVAAIFASLMYLLIGLFAGTITSVFAAFPKEMIGAIAGFALFSTVSSSLERALADPQTREASFITFAIAGSGLSFFGIGSAFWAIVVGVLTLRVFKPARA